MKNSIKMSDEENSRIRNRVLQHMNSSPQKNPDSLAIRLYTFFTQNTMRIPALVSALFLTFTGGVSLAAAHSLPGDFLHPFKVDVNEGIVSTFKFSDEDKLAWEISRAETRLEELKSLEDFPGKGVDRAHLLVQSHAGRINSLLARLETVDPETATELSQAFADLIAEYEAYLAQLSASDSGDRDSLHDLLDAMEDELKAAGLDDSDDDFDDSDNRDDDRDEDDDNSGEGSDDSEDDSDDRDEDDDSDDRDEDDDNSGEGSDDDSDDSDDDSDDRDEDDDNSGEGSDDDSDDRDEDDDNSGEGSDDDSDDRDEDDDNSGEGSDDDSDDRD